METDPETNLRKLDGHLIRSQGVTLRLRNVRRPVSREKECRYFEILLVEDHSEESDKDFISGLYNSGRSSLGIKSHFDIELNPDAFGKSENISQIDETLAASILQILAELVEPGGKIILAVASMRNPSFHQETFDSLDKGFPPEVTPLGYLLHLCGCGDFYKQWLIREGGREGPPALQGEKALNEDFKRRADKEKAERVLDFLKDCKEGKFRPEKVLVQRARKILRQINIEDEDLQRRLSAYLRDEN